MRKFDPKTECIGFPKHGHRWVFIREDYHGSHKGDSLYRCAYCLREKWNVE